MAKRIHYLGNPNLKRMHVKVDLTEEQDAILKKCRTTPTFFVENYLKVVTLDKGFTNISLYDFQKEAIDKIKNNRRVIIKAGRQVGKTTIVAGFILWYVLFNKSKKVALLSKDAATAREILDRLKKAYETLPLWMQVGVKTWNKGSIELENGSAIMASSCSSGSIRGYTFSLIYLDEFAFVPTNIAENFFTSTYPTISSGERSKILITSTPNGLNHFYNYWEMSDKEKMKNNWNKFVRISANWRAVPGRTQQWADEQLKILGEQKFAQEMDCEFIGSVGTLISGDAIRRMAAKTPVGMSENESLKLYDNPRMDRKYTLVADTSRGKGLDYHAFSVIDSTEIPYRLVATYRNNEDSPIAYAAIIRRVAEMYNHAYVMIEINDNGGQVADTLMDDLEYENIIHTERIDRKVAAVWGGSKRADRGVRTTASVKRLGCALLKTLIESDKLKIEDFMTISELSMFVVSGTSYEAQEGFHDDTVMSLVLFAWLTNQAIFSEINKVDARTQMYLDEKRKAMEEIPIIPIVLDDGRNQKQTFVSSGCVWEVVDMNDFG